MEDPQLPPTSRPHLGSTLSSSSLQLQHLQRSQHSRSGEVSETDSGWSDVFKDSDSSLEDFDTYGDYNHNNHNNDTISRQSTISSGNDSEDDDGHGVQVEGTPSNHTRSILTSDEDDWASDEDDMWNSSGDWDGNDTTLEQQQSQPVTPITKPQRSNSRSSLDEYLQNDSTNTTGKRDESTADSTDPSAAGSPQKRICHDQDRSGSLPPATGKALHDLSTPLGLADTALDFSEQTQEIVFDDPAGEEEEEDEEAWESQRNLQSSRSNGGWEEEEEEEEDEVDWDDPDDDGDWEDEEEEEEENKQEDSAAWDYDRVGTEDEDDQDWGEEADVKDKADGDIKAAKSSDSNREPTTFAQQFVVSSTSATTEKPIVLDASEEQHKGEEEEKEEIEPWHESDSSFSHVFEAVGSEHMRDRSQQQETIPEKKALTPIAAASLAPTIKTDNSFRSKSQPSIPQNPARQAPRKRYHIHKGQSRTPQDWECLLVQWEHMERAKKKEEQLRNRQTAAANYVQSTGGGSPLSEASDNINQKNPPNNASEERSSGLETASNDLQEKKSKKTTGKCLRNIIFPFSLAGKKKSKKQKNPESAR